MICGRWSGAAVRDPLPRAVTGDRLCSPL